MIYLDQAATALPKTPGLYARMEEISAQCGNPGRSGHEGARRGAAMLESARVSLARFFGARPSEVRFTPGCTWGLNEAIQAAVFHGRLSGRGTKGGGSRSDHAPRGGGHAVGTWLDHNAARRPLTRLADEGGTTIDLARPNGGGIVEPDEVVALLRPDTRLVVLPHASNVTGIVQPVAEIARQVRERSDAIVVVDAAQTAGVWPWSFAELTEAGVDAVALSGHKGLRGPFGVGLLLVADGFHPTPLVEGGTGGDARSPRQPFDQPEAGTPPLDGAGGLAFATEALTSFGGPVRVAQLERERLAPLLTRLAEDDRLGEMGLRPADGSIRAGEDARERVGVVSFRVFPQGRSKGLDTAADPHWVAELLDAQFGIAVRAGLHCAPGAHLWAESHERGAGLPPTGTGSWELPTLRGAVRVSVGPTTTETDIATLLTALDDVISLL